MFRQSQLKGRDRLRGLLTATQAVADQMDEMRPRFEALARNESATRAVSSFNLFQTPPALAARLAGMFDKPLGRILEPSAGLGRLYKAIRGVSAAPVVLVEMSAEICGELYRMTEGDNARLVQGDFLAQSPDTLGLFDAVIMNPPFKMGTDIKHIRHAQRFLAPGGKLVSLCAAGPKQRQAFAGLEWHDLPPDSFKSEGTHVNAAIVVIDA